VKREPGPTGWWAGGIAAALVLHAPMANHTPPEPACPHCHGGIYTDDPEAPRACGCRGLSRPLCLSCAELASNGLIYRVQWPCATYLALTSTHDR